LGFKVNCDKLSFKALAEAKCMRSNQKSEEKKAVQTFARLQYPNQSRILRYFFGLIYQTIEVKAPSLTTKNLEVFSFGVLSHLNLRDLFLLSQVNKYFFLSVRSHNELAQRLIDEIPIDYLEQMNKYAQIDLKYQINPKLFIGFGVANIGWGIMKIMSGDWWALPSILGGGWFLSIGFHNARSYTYKLKHRDLEVVKDLLSFMKKDNPRELLPCTPVQCVIS